VVPYITQNIRDIGGRREGKKIQPVDLWGLSGKKSEV
jgi:hypothetical protein